MLSPISFNELNSITEKCIIIDNNQKIYFLVKIQSSEINKNDEKLIYIRRNDERYQMVLYENNLFHDTPENRLDLLLQNIYEDKK
jgi:hypothetical protein